MTDILTVDLSGDFVTNDAQAIVSINGMQVGGILDVSAINAADQVNAFTFVGDFGADPIVSVAFVNQGQSNLYLDGFTYDGVTQLGYKQFADYDQYLTNQLTATPSIAERAGTFVNSIAVDVQLGDWNLSDGNASVVALDLAYAGFTTMRVGLPSSVTLSEFQSFGAAGMKFDVIMPEISSPALLPGQMAILDAMAPYVSAVEGSNEADINPSFNWAGEAGYAGVAAYQQALWNAVKADPELASASVYNATLGGGADGFAELGNLSADATDGNAHVYYPGVAPFAPLQYSLGLAATPTPGRPTVITETNYATAPLPYGVSQAVQASYDLDLLVDAVKQGVAMTYIYELLDDTADPNNTDLENHWGLFNADGTPKLAATGIHNLNSILADSGATEATFAPGKLAYTVAGLPASGDTLLLEKSNGAYDLVVWAEPAIWNSATNTAVAAHPSNVTVSLSQPAASVSVYDTLTGTTSIAQYTNASSITVTVTDHPVILEITPVAALALVMPAGSISALTATASSTSAHQGQTITFALATSEAVAVSTASGSPSLALSTGGTASYDAVHSTASMLAFTTTVTAGQSSADLQVTGLSLNGASITDANGNSLSIAGVPSLQGADTGIAVSTATPTVVLGSGPDTLALNVVEDAYQGDAQFTVSIDGVQVGGTQTAMALNGAGTSQEFDVNGSFGTSQHVVSVDFLNDLWAGTPDTDRNLYVTSSTVDGQAIANGTLTELSSGSRGITFSVTPSAPVITGLSAAGTGSSANSSSTSIVTGTAQAATTVTLYDGSVAVGSAVTTAAGTWGITPSVLSPGTQSLTATATNQAGEVSPASAADIVTISAGSISALTATASSTSAHQGQTITFALATSEAVAVSTASGSPSLALSTGGTASYDAVHSTASMLAFTTTVTAGQSSADLQVTGLSLNGASITDANGNSLSMAGVPSLQGADTGIAVSTATPTVVLGSGPDTLALNVVEDAYQGDAQFTVSIDGVQVGGTQTAMALNGAGTSQEFDVNGSFGTSQHVVSVDFLNDLWAGTPDTDRNLYVTSSTVDGQAIANGTLTELSSGLRGITFMAAPQSTTLTLHLAEDAWQGDAAYSVTVDGQSLGSGTATALNNLGQSQNITLQDILSPGAHDVGVSFLNDAWGGTPNTDRNLYVKGIDVNGAAQGGTSATLWANGTTHFQIVVQA